VVSEVTLVITLSILTSSMMADLVEASEIRTARRSEGVLFAATTFARKAVQGFGVLAASAVLTVAIGHAGARRAPESPLPAGALSRPKNPCAGGAHSGITVVDETAGVLLRVIPDI
jgi:hypothetical protein